MKPIWDEKKVMIVKWSRAHDLDSCHAQKCSKPLKKSSQETQGQLP